MSFRNAFTHGTFSIDAKSVWLSYFEGKPVRKELTDEYLAGVESKLLRAYEIASTLADKIGAMKAVEKGLTPG